MCAHTYMHTHVYLRTHTCAHICTLYTFAHIYCELCAYLYVHAYVYARVFLFVYPHACAYMSVNVHTCVRVYMFVYVPDTTVHPCAYACLCCVCACACVYWFTHVCICVCVCICMCASMRVCTPLCVCAQLCVCPHVCAGAQLASRGSTDAWWVRPPTFGCQLRCPLLTPPDRSQMLTRLHPRPSPPTTASCFPFTALRGTCGDITASIADVPCVSPGAGGVHSRKPSDRARPGSPEVPGCAWASSLAAGGICTPSLTCGAGD